MAKKFTLDELQQIETSFRDLVEDSEWSYLLVDNSVALRKTLANTIKKAGGESILEAKDGMEAMMLARKAEGKVAVVLELNLPVMDGIKFLQQFKSDERFKSSPVIIASTESKKPRIVAAIRAGANAYLKKPFEPQSLIDKLKELKAL